MNNETHSAPRTGQLVNGRVPVAIIVAVAVVTCSVAIGYLASNFDYKRLAMVVAAMALIWTVLKWPQWGLVLLLSFTSTVAAPEFFRGMASPNTVYYAIEALLLLVVAAAILAGGRTRKAGEPGVFQRIYASPQAIAITLFLVIVFIKAMVVIIEKRLGGGSLGQMFAFNRGLSYYLLFIPVLLLMNTEARQKWMITVLFVLASLIMIRVLLELLFPDWQVFQWASVAQPLADETPTVDLSVQRLRTPGGTVVLACFWIGLMNIILRPWKRRLLAIYVPLTLVMLVGILLEFNRSYVIPMMVLTVLALFLNKRMVRIKLLATVSITLLGLVLVFAATGQLGNYYDAMMVRYGSAFSSQAMESQSIVSREIEPNYAWQAIRKSPLLGIGLNELYRPPVPGMLDNLRFYIHNSYIWFWTYYGILGLAAFLGMMAVALLRSIFNWRHIRNPVLQASMLGFVFSLATLLAANFAAPKFYDFATVPVVALMLGMTEAITLSNRSK